MKVAFCMSEGGQITFQSGGAAGRGGLDTPARQGASDE